MADLAFDYDFDDRDRFYARLVYQTVFGADRAADPDFVFFKKLVAGSDDRFLARRRRARRFYFQKYDAPAQDDSADRAAFNNFRFHVVRAPESFRMDV